MDLAGHVLWVSNFWHECLDRSEVGDASPPFPWDAFGAKNAEGLAALPPGSGPDRIEEFVERANAFLDRVPGKWDLPFATPVATVAIVPMTVGLHVRIGPAEWHLRAWELAAAIGETYRPNDPAVMFDGLNAVFPIPPLDGDTWENTLRVSGRKRG